MKFGQNTLSAFLFFSFFILSNVHSIPVTFVDTVHKSGTHLLIRCIELLSDAEFEFTGHHATSEGIENRLLNLPENRFLVSHIPYDESTVQVVFEHEARLLFIYRDPRDQLVSFAHYVRRYDGPGQAWSMAASMTLDDIIYSLMLEDQLYHFWPGISGVDMFYRSFIPWIDVPGCLAIRFEDLIGPMGGGSLQKQREAIKAIAEHLNIYLTDEKLDYVVTHIFGNTGTFRVGKIGSWQNELNARQKKVFKDVAGQLLIDLGYEEDYNW